MTIDELTQTCRFCQKETGSDLKVCPHCGKAISEGLRMEIRDALGTLEHGNSHDARMIAFVHGNRPYKYVQERTARVGMAEIEGESKEERNARIIRERKENERDDEMCAAILNRML
jgi:hypothetical protein